MYEEWRGMGVYYNNYSKDISDVTYCYYNMPTRELLAGETKNSFV